MNDVRCLSHTKWKCTFHIVWIPVTHPLHDRGGV